MSHDFPTWSSALLKRAILLCNCVRIARLSYLAVCTAEASDTSVPSDAFPVWVRSAHFCMRELVIDGKTDICMLIDLGLLFESWFLCCAGLVPALQRCCDCVVKMRALDQILRQGLYKSGKSRGLY